MRRVPAVAHLLAGGVVCLAGLVAVVPHQTALMWQASVVLSEGGHWLALPSALLLLGWRRSLAHRLAAVLALCGIAMLLTPVARAYSVAASLPGALTAAFGAPSAAPSPDAAPRSAPIVASELLFGVRSDDVEVEEHVYAVVGGRALTLDVYRRAPVDAAPRPVVVVVHGGAWIGGTRGEFPGLSRYLAARGYVVASIDYRLAPWWRFPAAQEDLARAIAYIKGLETTHGIDPTRIALLGRSAGAQIVLLAAYTASDPAIRGVVSLYGPAALRWGYYNPAKARVIDSSRVLEVYLGGPPKTHGAQYDAAEPARFVTPASPPTLFVQGLHDEHVAPFHANLVSSRLIEAGVLHAVVWLPWATHGCDFVFSGPCGQIVTYAVERFLGAVLSS